MEVLSVGPKFVQLSRKDVARARKLLFRREADAAVYEKTEVVRRRLQKITTAVRVQCTSFRSINSALSVIMQVAVSNSFPALGADIWTATRLILPAGFITIRGSDHDRVSTLADALLKEL